MIHTHTHTRTHTHTHTHTGASMRPGFVTSRNWSARKHTLRILQPAARARRLGHTEPCPSSSTVPNPSRPTHDSTSVLTSHVSHSGSVPVQPNQFVEHEIPPLICSSQVSIYNAAIKRCVQTGQALVQLARYLSTCLYPQRSRLVAGCSHRGPRSLSAAT